MVDAMNWKILNPDSVLGSKVMHFVFFQKYFWNETKGEPNGAKCECKQNRIGKTKLITEWVLNCLATAANSVNVFGMWFGQKCGETESELCINGNSSPSAAAVAVAVASFSLASYLNSSSVGMWPAIQVWNKFVAPNSLGLCMVCVCVDHGRRRTRRREKKIFIFVSRQCRILLAIALFQFFWIRSSVCVRAYRSLAFGIFEIFSHVWVCGICASVRHYQSESQTEKRRNSFTLKDHSEESICEQWTDWVRRKKDRKRKTKTTDIPLTTTRAERRNIFISFQREILKHKIESEFRLHILAISQNYFSEFHMCAIVCMCVRHWSHTMAESKRCRATTLTHKKKKVRIDWNGFEEIFSEIRIIVPNGDGVKKRGCGRGRTQFSPYHQITHFCFWYKCRPSTDRPTINFDINKICYRIQLARISRLHRSANRTKNKRTEAYNYCVGEQWTWSLATTFL